METNAPKTIRHFELTHLVTLNVTPAWQPTSEETGKTAEFYCGMACFRVEWTAHDGATHYHHGAWVNLDDAHRFAISCPSQHKPIAVACEPYMYCPAYGRLDAHHKVNAKGEAYKAARGEWACKCARCVVLARGDLSPPDTKRLIYYAPPKGHSDRCTRAYEVHKREAEARGNIAKGWDEWARYCMCGDTPKMG